VKAEDLKPGVTVLVPAGADSARRLPYRLLITKVNWVASDGETAHVVGKIQRLDGTPTRRKFESRFITLRVGRLKVVPAGPAEKITWTPYSPRRIGRHAWLGTVCIESEHRPATSITCSHRHDDRDDAMRCATEAAERWTAAGVRGTFDAPG
jgi:hypothetical protein